MTIFSQEQLFGQCAEALTNGQSLVQQPEPVQALITALGYDDAPDMAAVAQVQRHRTLLLQAAAGFARLFQLRSPDAPGLMFFGAEVDPGAISPGGVGQRRLSASGAGFSLRAAFEGCIGEGVELLSQFEHHHDGFFRAPLVAAAASRATAMGDVCAELLQQAGQARDAALDWVVARRHSDNEPTAFPADICFRRGSRRLLIPSWPLSIGCAAGTSFEGAVLHGLLELVERDAAALWWRGGMRGHLVPLDAEAMRHLFDLLAQARGGQRRRRAWLLDITTDLGIPSIAAISVHEDGHGFACGLAARLSLTLAVEAAVLEMCQMELAHEVIAAKRRESGDAALNEHDLAHLRRSQELKINDCLLLHPLPPRTGGLVTFEAAPAKSALRQLLAHLASHGLETFVVDLTRPAFGIPVGRVLCPGLDIEPSQLVGRRLQAVLESTGGGYVHTGGLPLV